jgi:small subunit ribosomal protein S4
VTIPGFRIRVGDAVEDKSKQLALVLEATAQVKRDMPDYIDADHTRMTRCRCVRKCPTR